MMDWNTFYEVFESISKDNIVHLRFPQNLIRSIEFCRERMIKYLRAGIVAMDVTWLELDIVEDDELWDPTEAMIGLRENQRR